MTKEDIEMLQLDTQEVMEDIKLYALQEIEKLQAKWGKVLKVNHNHEIEYNDNGKKAINEFYFSDELTICVYAEVENV